MLLVFDKIFDRIRVNTVKLIGKEFMVMEYNYKVFGNVL